MRIVADSSGDIMELAGVGEGVSFAVAPLKIITSEKEYTDDNALDVAGMVNDLAAYKGRSSTSCPNMTDWIQAFGDEQYVFCVTISGNISGSCNAAMLAKETYEGLYPERRVCVIDTKSTGPSIRLVVEKLRDLIHAGEDFESVCEKIAPYNESLNLVFMLESMNNLANNGRVSTIAAKAAGFLGIRVVGRASESGTLELLDKCRGEDRALLTLAKRIRELGWNGGTLYITHCFNEEAAKKLKNLLRRMFKHAQIEIGPCGGLCSFYVEKHGLIIGFECEEA